MSAGAVIFLHGSGDTGANLKHGLAYYNFERAGSA
jgi:poly(3-hydroxybutyrate) depolymerase